MRTADTQLGTPDKLYKDTQANIEALTGVVEGAVAYATDTDSFGVYNGSAWQWYPAQVVQVVHRQGGDPDDWSVAGPAAPIFDSEVSDPSNILSGYDGITGVTNVNTPTGQLQFNMYAVSDHYALFINNGAVTVGSVDGNITGTGDYSILSNAGSGLGGTIHVDALAEGQAVASWSMVFDYTVPVSEMLDQYGTATITIGNGNNTAAVLVTFPTAFADNPLMMYGRTSQPFPDPDGIVVSPSSLHGTSSAAFHAGRNGTTGDLSVTFWWHAVGPKP